jgi:signal peptidase I
MDIAAPAADSTMGPQQGWPQRRGGRSMFSGWLVGVIAIWLAGVSLQGVRLLMALHAVRALVRRSMPCSADEADLVARLAARVGLTTPPRVRISSEIDTPQLVGVLRPIVLMPADAVAFTGDERSMALAHELVHVRRHDLALGWLPAVAGHLFFFHPMARLMSREYVTAREAACDAAVVRVLGLAPQDYGRLLVRAGVAASTSAFAAESASGSASTLRRRLVMLQRVDTKVSRLSIYGIAAVIIAAAMPFRLVAFTPSPPPVPAVSTIRGPVMPIISAMDVTVPAGPAAQGTDASAAQRQAIQEQLRKLEEARRALEAREAEMRGTLEQKLAELEAARAQLEEAKRSVAERMESIQRERQKQQLFALAQQVAAAQAAIRAQPARSVTYDRGDIVALAPDGDGTRPPNSRVLAVAGDQLRVAKTGIVVNGQPSGGLSPEFLAGLPEDPWEQTVPPGHVFVIADQRSASGASRFWGLIPAERIEGRAVRRR